MRDLWKKIGISDADVYQGKEYLDLRPSEKGRRQPLTREGPPQPQQLRAICDLVVQPDQRVDALTLQAFLHSRQYFNALDPLSLDSFILNALTIGDADISSRACRNVFRQWLPVFTQPNWDGLRGSLDRVLIQRLQQAIETSADSTRSSYEVKLHHRLVGLEIENGTARVTIEGPSSIRVYEDNPIILAIPQEVLRLLANNQLYERLPQVARLHRLRSNPFTAIDVFFTEKLDDLGPEHFTLTGSKYGLTAFEISQHWPELRDYPGSVVQFVAARSRQFRGLDGSGYVKAMIKELQRYFPEIPDKVAFFAPHLNMDVPLFVNDVGTWDSRPANGSGYRNLVFAGDFCQNETDVTSMEGAVRSGRDAAETIRQAYAKNSPPVHIQKPVDLPAELAAAVGLWPFEPDAARQMCLAWFLREISKRPQP